MNFRYRLCQALLDLTDYFLQTHFISLRMAGFFAESAEFAAIDADIGIIDVLVDNVIGLVAVPLLPDDVRQIPHSQKIVAAIQG